MKTMTAILLLLVTLIGGAALLTVFCMWAFPGMMTGPMGGAMNPAALFIGILVVAIVITAIIWLVRSPKGS